MPVFTKTLSLSAVGCCDLQDLTEEVKKALAESGIKDGLVCVFVSGSTAGITTIECEPNLARDFCELMEKLVPRDLKTRHGKTWGDDNGFSHLRAALIGPSVTVPFHEGRPALGTWQQIVLCDFDNRSRNREVTIQIVGDAL